jgi:transposase-like protein
MSANFLQTAKARTLSLATVIRMTDEQAFETFKGLRWHATNGEPVCPRCDCAKVYTCADREWKCAACRRRFSVTSGTLFHGRKLAIRDYLAAIAMFVNGASGVAALRMSRDLNVQHKTAFVLLHKLREAMAAEQAGATVCGTVAVDGAYFGGHVKPENRAEDRKDLRLKENQSGKRQAVVVLREFNGRALPFVFRNEAQSVSTVVSRIRNGSTVHADEAPIWDELHAKFRTFRVNHSIAFFDEGACTNWAESYFSRLRRAEVGVHHHIAGPYLNAYASEMAWREDHRRKSNGAQFQAVTVAALSLAKSRQWCGYWQRGR